MSLIPGGIRGALKRGVRRWAARHEGLRLWEFPQWSATLDGALDALPPLPNCPHDIYRALAQPRGDVRKVTLLVSERDAPVAVVALRSAGDVWEPVTTWITPGLPFPCAQPDIVPVLHAMAMPMRLAWWRCRDEPPRSRRVLPSPSEPTYRLPCDVDAEEVWRDSGLLHNIRNARRRCERFQVVVDGPGGVEWAVSHWGGKWRVPDDRLADILEVARLRQAAGRYHSVVAYDGDRRIGGLTSIDDDGDLVGQASYRDAEYDRYSLGTFMFDRLVAWAAGHGFKGLDFGGTAPYKQRWAPVGGRKFMVSVTPLDRLVGDALRTPWRGLRRLSRSAEPAAAPATPQESEPQF